MAMKEIKNVKPAAKTVSFQDYFYANLYFWGFLVVIAIISFFTCGAVWDDVTSGTMEFLFEIMGFGFTAVSILDFLYETKIAEPARETSKSR
jgi:hypothetical protein